MSQCPLDLDLCKIQMDNKKKKLIATSQTTQVSQVVMFKSEQDMH